jgi:hypothetical protein
MWVLGILALLVGALVLVIIMLLLGPLVGPRYEIVVNDPAVQKMGYDVGAEVAMRIGAKYVPPLIGLSLVIWFLVMRLASDSYSGIERRR